MARRKQQRRIDTENALLAAVESVILRDGVGALGVNTVAAEAGVDKVLIYRYFDGLGGLLRAFGEAASFWPSLDEVFDGVDDASVDVAKRARRFFENYANGLRRRPVTLAILAFEQVERNELTVILEEVREDWSTRMDARFAELRFPLEPEHLVVSRLFSAAIHYLAIRSRTIRVYGAVDIQSDAGWTTMLDGIEATFRALVDTGSGT